MRERERERGKTVFFVMIRFHIQSEFFINVLNEKNNSKILYKVENHMK